jgi:hypothetical protein
MPTLDAGRSRPGRRRQIGIGAAALAIVSALAVVAVTVSAGPAPDRRSLPAGYIWESNAGLVVAVPTSWAVTSYFHACGDPPPTLVLRAPDPTSDLVGCAQPDYVSELAYVQRSSGSGTFAAMPSATPRRVSVDGVAALRASGEIAPGGVRVWVGFVIFASPDASVYVRTSDLTTLTMILDSVHLLR